MVSLLPKKKKKANTEGMQNVVHQIPVSSTQTNLCTFLWTNIWNMYFNDLNSHVQMSMKEIRWEQRYKVTIDVDLGYSKHSLIRPSEITKNKIASNSLSQIPEI